MSDTCPGCGQVGTLDPQGTCHHCQYGRPNPAAAALREQVREIARVRDEVLGSAGERFARSGIPGAIRRAVRGAVAEVLDRSPTPEALGAAVAAGVRDGL